MRLGRKIYWDSVTGGIVVDRLEMEGAVRESTVDEDFQSYINLRERAPNSILGILLDPEKYSEDFLASSSFRIIESSKLVEGITTLIGEKNYDFEFSFSDTNTPDEPPAFYPPLTEQVAELRAADLDNKEAIASLFEMMLTGGV